MIGIWCVSIRKDRGDREHREDREEHSTTTQPATEEVNSLNASITLNNLSISLDII